MRVHAAKLLTFAAKPASVRTGWDTKSSAGRQTNRQWQGFCCLNVVCYSTSLQRRLSARCFSDLLLRGSLPCTGIMALAVCFLTRLATRSSVFEIIINVKDIASVCPGSLRPHLQREWTSAIRGQVDKVQHPEQHVLIKWFARSRARTTVPGNIFN